MENFNKFLAEEEDASQMPADTSMGNPKPYPENEKASGKLELDVGLEISRLLFGKISITSKKIFNPENDIERIHRIHAELESSQALHYLKY